VFVLYQDNTENIADNLFRKLNTGVSKILLHIIERYFQHNFLYCEDFHFKQVNIT
jgi:hypothetical protein